jgi:ATP-dependent Clp protease adapter protein ClpS
MMGENAGQIMPADRIAAKVILLNDDKTTMEFVVQVLENIFGKTRDEALKMVLGIHRDGAGVCGSMSPSVHGILL